MVMIALVMVTAKMKEINKIRMTMRIILSIGVLAMVKMSWGVIVVLVKVLVNWTLKIIFNMKENLDQLANLCNIHLAHLFLECKLK